MGVKEDQNHIILWISGLESCAETVHKLGTNRESQQRRG